MNDLSGLCKHKTKSLQMHISIPNPVKAIIVVWQLQKIKVSLRAT